MYQKIRGNFLSLSTNGCKLLLKYFSLFTVEPPSLVAIFSVEAETGVVVVDATGPGLLAEGALGHINVCSTLSK